MKTRGGKMYFKLASLLLNLREKVAEAVATNDPGAWRQVEKVLSQVLSQFDLSENSKASMSPEEFREHQFVRYFPEFQPARREVEYQVKVRSTLQKL